MTIASYGLKRYLRGGLRTLRRSFTCITLGILTASLVFCGCSSRARPLQLAFTGMSFAPDAAGLSDLLTRLPKMSADDRKNNLRGFADSPMASAELKQKASYVLGRELQMSGTTADLQDAVAHFQEAAKIEALADRCEWHIAECAGKLGDEKTARDALERLSSEHSTGDEGAQALYALGQSYMRTGDRTKARQIFSSVLRASPESQFALGSTYYLAQLDLADVGDAQKQTAGTAAPGSGDKLTGGNGGTVGSAGGDAGSGAPPQIDTAAMIERATQGLVHYLAASPDGRFSTEIVSQLQQMPGFHASPAIHNLFAEAFYANSAYDNALSEWKAAGNTSAWFKQATCLIRLGRAAQGKSLLSSGLQSRPSDEAVPAAAAMLCRMLNRDGAIAVWKGVLQRSPKFADVAMYNLATRAPTDQIALDYYRRIIGAYPNSAYAPESAWWVAWNSIKAGKSKDALAQLQIASAHYPEAKATPRFLYWTGKMYERLGNKEQAKAAYARTAEKSPWHYYAHRAEARLAALQGGKDPGWGTNPSRQPHWTHDTVEDWQFPEPPTDLAKQAGAVLEVLTELKQWEECLELTSEQSGLLRAFYLAKLNMPLEAINSAGKAMHGRPELDEGWELAYPLLYAKFISNEAPAKHVDPFLVQALIREESRYNTQAISGSHALGLMQLMPGTAYGVAKRLGVALKSSADIHDPETNMRLGIDYLSYVLRRFGGNALFAVASYNGGPNAVQRWSAHMPADTDVFVENIPFSETREYVRKVFGSYWNYQQIYDTHTTVR